MKKLNIFKNKKAMGVAQAFMYIVLVLTFGFIMIFGVKSVLDFKCKAESVQFFQFKNQIEADVKKIYSEFGSLRKVDYTLPEGMNQICFVDLDTNPEGEGYSDFNDLCNRDPDVENDIYDPYACEVWKDAWEVEDGENGWKSMDENVFFYPKGKSCFEAPKIKTYKIKIYDETETGNKAVYCPPVTRGKFSLILEGKGDRTEISSAENPS